MPESTILIEVERRCHSSKNTIQVVLTMDDCAFPSYRQLFIPYFCATGGAVTSALAMNRMVKVN